MLSTLSTSLSGGTWTLGDLTVTRFGYGAMQLAGPWVMGPPTDHDGALAVLRAAVDLGITHIDTSEAYGPRITNELIREALHPYPGSLHIVTKVGANRDAQGGWPRPGARSLGATPTSVALAWTLRRSSNILLIPGTSSTAHLRENLAGAGLSLSPEDMAELDDISS